MIRLIHQRHEVNTQKIHDNLVLECLVCHSVTAGVFTGSAKNIMAPLYSDLGDEEFMGWNALTDFVPRFHVVYGLSWDILCTILNISRFSNSISTNGILSTEELLECLQLGQKLSDWTPVPREIINLPCMATPDTHSMLAMSARIWRVAELIVRMCWKADD